MNQSDIVRAMVTSEYKILKYSGEQVKDLEYGIYKLLEYLPKDLVSEKLVRKNLEKYNLENMLVQIQKYFKREYHFTDEKMELNNRYQKSIGSYICYGKEEGENYFIHIDELYEAAVLPFLLAMFKWTKEFDDLETYGFGFIHVLYTLNDVSILGRLPDANAMEALLKAVYDDMQLMNLAEECYWTITAFNIAHEVAHAYLGRDGKNREMTRKQLHQEEFDADKIAYDIVLKMIIDGKDLSHDERLLEEYTYLAPIIFMDYIDLVYYTDRVLYHAYVGTETHPLLKKRKDRLFSIPYDDKYRFDTIEGNKLYNGFLDVYDEYRTQLLLKKERGKLEGIIDQEHLRMEEQKNGQRRGRSLESENQRLFD